MSILEMQTAPPGCSAGGAVVLWAVRGCYGNRCWPSDGSLRFVNRRTASRAFTQPGGVRSVLLTPPMRRADSCAARAAFMRRSDTLGAVEFPGAGNIQFIW